MAPQAGGVIVVGILAIVLLLELGPTAFDSLVEFYRN